MQIRFKLQLAVVVIVLKTCHFHGNTWKRRKQCVMTKCCKLNGISWQNSIQPWIGLKMLSIKMNIKNDRTFPKVNELDYMMMEYNTMRIISKRARFCNVKFMNLSILNALYSNSSFYCPLATYIRRVELLFPWGLKMSFA